MGRRLDFSLTEEEKKYLESVLRIRTGKAHVAQRSRILLLKDRGLTYDCVAEKVGVNRNTVVLCLQKYKADGIEGALYDRPGRGRKPEITDEEKAWIKNIACRKPKELGFAAELWTYRILTQYINKNAESAGYPRLREVRANTINRILLSSDIKPYKIRYYCERRDADFEEKMHNVLVVYKQLEFCFDEDCSGNDGGLPEPDGSKIHVLSYDEKPGIQATAVTSEDLNPTEKNGYVARDYEYKRLGTLSLLAGIDLLTGEAVPLVSRTHNSDDYVNFLRILDKKYPEGDKIRLVLDNLQVHKSKKVREYLLTVQGRFEFVFTPKHGSWLNMIEGFFGKMTRQFLRGLRVKSLKELEERIYKYFSEINEEPVVFHWTYKMDDTKISDKVKTETLLEDFFTN